MISASADDGLALIFCDGPVSLVSKGEGHASGHHHNSETGEAQQEVHVSPICTEWATSGILVVNTLFEPASVFEAISVEHTFYEVQPVEQSFYHTSYIRGPPHHS